MPPPKPSIDTDVRHKKAASQQLASAGHRQSQAAQGTFPHNSRNSTISPDPLLEGVN